MSEKETLSKERKTAIILLPVVAVAAFLLGFMAFGMMNGKGAGADDPEPVPSAEAVAGEEGWRRAEEKAADKGAEGDNPDSLPASGEAAGTYDAELEALAEKYNISVGKASLIQEVTAQKPGLTFESLVPMTINEIAQILSEENSSGQASDAPAAQKSAGVSQAQTNEAGAGTGTGNSSYIGEAVAKEKALADAGVKESDTSYMSCYVDYDDGRAEHYKVEFILGNTEYEYEIDLYSGAVLEKSMDTDNVHHAHYQTAGTGNSSGSYIGEEAAWTAALAHAGLTETEVVRKKVKLDEEDGIMIYEVEFEKGRVEYDYEIHAVSGEILKAETDRD